MRRAIILLSVLAAASLACGIPGAGGQNSGGAGPTQDPGAGAVAQTDKPDSGGAETSDPDNPHKPTRQFPATETPGSGLHFPTRQIPATATPDSGMDYPTRQFPPTHTPNAPKKFTPHPGGIGGLLSYPSNFIPALRIVVFHAAGMTFAADTVTNPGDVKYTMSIPAGTYYVVAYTLDGGLAAGYTEAVTCGLTVNCTDHSLIPVIVASGSATGDVNPQDWYAPAGTFPPMP